jgi:hypothetical protein
MGRVYLARDEVLNRDVALKVLRDRYAESEEFVERFRREARSAAALSHPNVVSVYDLGRSGDGTYLIAMEYVPGGTLKDRVDADGPLDPGAAAELGSQVAEALGAAHERGVIHRDVKPQNILLTASGDAKVADFGIARATAAATISQTGRILGTARYMSPEQAMGKPVGPASDLYSLGVVLYEALTGETPFEAETLVAIAVKHAEEPPRPPKGVNSGVSEGMNALVLRLLAKKPEDRYADAAELAEDLRRVRDGLPPLVAGGSDAAARFVQVPSAAPARTLALRSVLIRMALILGLIVSVVTGSYVYWSYTNTTGLGAAVPEVAANQVKEAEDSAPDVNASEENAAEPIDSVFVHRATPESISANSTYLDDRVTNGNPDAILSITRNWNPEGDGVYNDHPVGVWYDTTAERWAIFNEDRAAMPEGAAFNVVVWAAATGAA